MNLTKNKMENVLVVDIRRNVYTLTMITKPERSGNYCVMGVTRDWVCLEKI